MATVPNYYYQSPWIEAAGRNLATALQPPDPDKLRAREKAEWEFAYAKNKARNEATDRENDQFAATKLGELGLLLENPVLDAQGQPDPVATRAKAAQIRQEIYARGGPKYVNEAEAVSGPMSSTFLAKQEFKEASDETMFRALGIKQGFQAGESEKTRDYTTERDERLHQQRLQYLGIQGDQRLAAINARNAAQKVTNAMTLTKPIGDAIMTGIYQRMRSTGKKLDDAAIYRLFDEIADDTSRNTKNYATSLERIWNSRFPGGVYERKKHWWEGNNDDEYITPDFAQPIPAFGADSPAAAPDQTTPAPDAEGPRDLGTTVTTAPPANFKEFGDRERDTGQILLDRQAANAAPQPQQSPAPRGGKADGKSEASPIPVKTPADAAKLPGGTWVITPQGRVSRTKRRPQ